MATDPRLEYNPTDLVRDTRSRAAKFASQVLANPQNALVLTAGAAACAWAFPTSTELFFGVGAFLNAWAYNVQKKAGLPLRLPKSSQRIDAKEIDLATGKPLPAEGIIYLGNEEKTGNEVWLSDTMARTHMLFMGTTGSGKALSNRSLVLTPGGWKLMGDIVEGDVLCLPGGTFTTVKGVYPQGRKRMFVMSLASHGGERKQVECCDEHLWLARIDGDERVARTDEIIGEFSRGAEIFVPVSDVSADGAGVHSASCTTWVALESIKKGSMQHATCILVDSEEHLFITNGGVVTHNTEFLISLVYNALIHGSGFIYVDGKADSSLYGKIYSMARSVGREDDVVVVNFQTGAKDIFGPQPFKMSNTLNPFSVGSSGMLTQLVVSLMSTGKGDVWENRAISFVEALMKPLVFLRDKYGLMLDVGLIRDYFEIKRLEELAWRDADRYPGLEVALDGLRSYLLNLPTYDKAKFQQQGETALEQHGYITMQLVRTFNSLADTYGYIMKTPLAEIDFLDVFLNRRILVVLLPALEKSPSELTNLGRIIVASIKATMAVGLGAQIEGDWAKIIDAKPTNSPSPFMCVLDEYGYYAVEGFAVVPAQARSLGFSAVFAGQDLPAFQKASEKEAESTLANTNTKFCGKLECTKTAKYFGDLAAQGYFTRAGGFEVKNGLMDATYAENKNASIEKFDRISFNDLRGQKSGQWHLFFANEIVKIKSFFAAPKKVRTLRVNHFISVGRPGEDEAEAYKIASDHLAAAIASPGGLNDYLDTVMLRELIILNEGFEALDGVTTTFESAIASTMHYSTTEKLKFDAFQKLLNGIKQPEDEADLASFDATPHDQPESNAETSEGPAAQMQEVVHSSNGFDFVEMTTTLGNDMMVPTEQPALPARSMDAEVDDTGYSEELFDTIAPADPVELTDDANEQAALAIAAHGQQMENDQAYGAAAVVDSVVDDEEGMCGNDEFAVLDETLTTNEKVFIADTNSCSIVHGATVFGAVVNEQKGEVVGIDDANPELDRDNEDEAVSFGHFARRNRKRKQQTVRGLLDRDETAARIEKMERSLGRSGIEAAQTASAVTSKLAESTTYPITAPAGPVTTEQFKQIARNLSDALDEVANGIGNGGSSE